MCEYQTRNLRGIEEKAPPFRAGMNPTLPFTVYDRKHDRIFHAAAIHIFK